jgi:hypothetical protein
MLLFFKSDCTFGLLHVLSAANSVLYLLISDGWCNCFPCIPDFNPIVHDDGSFLTLDTSCGEYLNICIAFSYECTFN